MPTPKGGKPWNAGKGKGWVDQRGYRWLQVEDRGRIVSRREHRVIMERHLGRNLEPWELVHHKDGDKANNELSNLEVREFGEHTAEHSRGRRHSAEAKRSMEAFALMREELKRERALNADLLEALQGLIAFAEAAETKMLVGDEGCLWPVEFARAAISRATGASK